MKPSLVPYMLLQSMKVHQFSRIRNLLPNPTCIAGSHSTPQCKTLPSPTPIITPHTYEGHTGGSVFPCSLVPPKPLGDPHLCVQIRNIKSWCILLISKAKLVYKDLWRRAFARNVRLRFLYRQYTNFLYFYLYLKTVLYPGLRFTYTTDSLRNWS